MVIIKPRTLMPERSFSTTLKTPLLLSCCMVCRLPCWRHKNQLASFSPHSKARSSCLREAWRVNKRVYSLKRASRTCRCWQRWDYEAVRGSSGICAMLAWLRQTRGATSGSRCCKSRCSHRLRLINASLAKGCRAHGMMKGGTGRCCCTSLTLASGVGRDDALCAIFFKF